MSPADQIAQEATTEARVDRADAARQAVLADADLLFLIFRGIYAFDGPHCSRVECPCTSTFHGIAGAFCSRMCYRGRPCTHNVHRTPFNPRSLLRPPRVSLVCNVWRKAWDEAQVDWIRRPYPAALYWLQGVVHDVSLQGRRDADRLSREAASRREMGAIDTPSTSDLIAQLVATEGNLYAAARVHERRVTPTRSVDDVSSSLALTILSLRTGDSTPREVLAHQLHDATVVIDRQQDDHAVSHDVADAQDRATTSTDAASTSSQSVETMTVATRLRDATLSTTTRDPMAYPALPSVIAYSSCCRWRVITISIDASRSRVLCAECICGHIIHATCGTWAARRPFVYRGRDSHLHGKTNARAVSEGCSSVDFHT